MDKKVIADIQEVTATCIENGIYSRLFEDGSKFRDEIMELFAKWGREFHESHKDFIWDGTVSYYDEIDAFVREKFNEYTNPYIDRRGETYVENKSLPAGGGLHRGCDYNAEALYAYYAVKSREGVTKYLTSKGFELLLEMKGFQEWKKGNTRITFEDYDNAGQLWTYLHTEIVDGNN